MQTLFYKSIRGQPKPNTSIINVLAIPCYAPMEIPYTLTKDKKWSTKAKSHHEGEHDIGEDIYYTIIYASIDKCKATKKSIWASFRLQIGGLKSTVALSFVFGKYCPIMD
jgi:hypothetical protein